MHPNLLLLPIILRCLQPLATAAGDAPQGTVCAPATCGNLTIAYPFWLGGGREQPSTCGPPEFELSCKDSRSGAFLSGSYIKVLDIHYGNSSFVAVHSPFAAYGACSANFNLSSALAINHGFTLSRTNKELYILYNCSGTRPPGSDPVFNCSDGNPRFAFLGGSYNAGLSPVAHKRCEFAMVPVLVSEASAAMAADYSRLIEGGFLLEWTPVGDCNACRASGGQCRYDASSSAAACLCSDGGLRATTCDGNASMKMVLIVLMAVTASLLFPCLCVLMRRRKEQKLWFFHVKTRGNTQTNIEDLLRKHGSLAPTRYRFSEVKKITSSFSTKLGEGGYGMVFKGSLHDGRLVAVKFLHDSKGNGEEFVNEVMSIGRTSHVNIVSLLGFCLEGTKRALICEYMSNGSLDKYIYSENPKAILGWEKLYTIAIGIARGLEYLHQGCNTRIIHFDIKPHNILLDKDFCPKIADFGLAKLCRAKQSKLSMTGARGTIGFIAPEVFSRSFGVVSTKSDVYSYGMLLLEMVGGRKNMKTVVDKSSEAYFPEWIYDHLAEYDGLRACEVTSEAEEIAKKMTLIGLWCVQMMPLHRPTISQVLEMFERSIDELDMPPKQNLYPIPEDSAQSLDVESSSATDTRKPRALSDVLQVEEISLINSTTMQRLPTL